MAVNLKRLFLVYKWLMRSLFSGCSIKTLCCLCDARILAGDQGLCTACAEDLPRNQPACPGCAMPTVGAHYCPPCLQTPKREIDQTYALYRYEYPVNRLIQAMKFHSQPAYTKLFGAHLLKAIQTGAIDLPGCLVPVPLHRRRLAERGYNQSQEIAKAIATRHQIPLHSPRSTRNRHTRPQTELSGAGRQRNVAGAFSIDGSLTRQHVVIVDDVVTSGATVAALARSLRKAGAKRVDVWVCARAGVR